MLIRLLIDCACQKEYGLVLSCMRQKRIKIQAILSHEECKYFIPNKRPCHTPIKVILKRTESGVALR